MPPLPDLELLPREDTIILAAQEMKAEVLLTS
jgi:hypothetical protein